MTAWFLIMILTKKGLGAGAYRVGKSFDKPAPTRNCQDSRSHSIPKLKQPGFGSASMNVGCRNRSRSLNHNVEALSRLLRPKQIISDPINTIVRGLGRHYPNKVCSIVTGLKVQTLGSVICPSDRPSSPSQLASSKTFLSLQD
jgi:hypothetical protein